MDITTVSPVKAGLCSAVLGPALATVAAAEAGRRLLRPRGAIAAPAPVTLTDHFSEEEIARGRRYARPQRALALVRSGLDLSLLTVLVARPPRALSAQRSRPVASAAAAGAAMTVALALPGLPLRVIARRRAVTAGLDTNTWRGWLSDLAKQTALSAGLGAATDAAVIAAARRWPQRWWLYAAGGTIAVGSLLGALAPVILDPIFNDFTPLPEGETRSDVLALAHDAGVGVGDVYSVDASRRTTAANAYVTGLGPTKRVVIFDTMLDRYSRDEIRLVVAHELGHMRHRDVPRNVAYASILAPAVAWAVQHAVTGLRGGDAPLAARGRRPAGADARRGSRLRARRSQRGRAVTGDGAPGRSVLARAGRCPRGVYLLRARGGPAESRRPAPDPAGARAGQPSAGRRAHRRRAHLRAVNDLSTGVAVPPLHRRSQPSNARMTITQFWPPKPNALAAATRTGVSRATSGT